VACLLLVPPRIGMTGATPLKAPCYEQPWTHNRSVIPIRIRLSRPVPHVFGAAFGAVAWRVRFGEMRLWSVSVKLEVAGRPKREKQEGLA
jgi:hypothetical protein